LSGGRNLGQSPFNGNGTRCDQGGARLTHLTEKGGEEGGKTFLFRLGKNKIELLSNKVGLSKQKGGTSRLLPEGERKRGRGRAFCAWDKRAETISPPQRQAFTKGSATGMPREKGGEGKPSGRCVTDKGKGGKVACLSQPD